jgi:hypothetical protein
MTRIRVFLLLTILLGTAACRSATPQPAATGPTGSAGASAAAEVDPAALRTARAFIDALNRGDGEAARTLLAPAARFDSAGRVFPDRDAIMDDFLIPDVIRPGGRYTEKSVTTADGRLVAEYEFGAGEHFTYAYRISDGLITDVIGRYV